MTKRPIEEYWEAPATCLPYDPRAPEVASKVAEMIRQRLPGVSVEHFGSTAVPGCAGKGVVDLLVPYREGQLEPIKLTLEELGFQRQSTRDPFPEERPMRVGSVKYEGDTFRLHVHVVPAPSGEPEKLRVFRERLRTDPGLLRSYVARKRNIISSGTTDPVAYAEAKGSFIEQTLETH